MKHAWVLRHAKAEAGAPGGDDHERALTHRGRRQGAALADVLPSLAGPGRSLPGLVLCSTAVRARQTAAEVLGALGPGVVVEEERALYQADADEVLERLRLVDDDEAGVMIVGHNPTLHDLCLDLVAGDDAGLGRLSEGFPTAALAVIALDAPSWARLAPGSGRLAELVTVTGR
ncbi:MAG TPA: histidine phosphatase family protein [Acidimicrobiales bacterium]|nr:histidine phosphatase family protein [Acidimicrobiales bacterium]